MKSRVRKGIDVVRGVSGGDACIAGTRIAVWTLEQARRLGASDEELLRAYPTLRVEDPNTSPQDIEARRCSAGIVHFILGHRL